MRTLRAEARERFESALRHALAAVVVLLTFLFFIVAPSSDIRARIPFLLLLTPMSLLFSWLTSALIALGATILVQGFSRESIAAAAAAATIGHVFVLSGFATRLLPEVGERWAGWLVSACAIAGFLAYVVHQRSRHRRPAIGDAGR